MADLKQMDYMGYTLKEVQLGAYRDKYVNIYKNDKLQTQSITVTFTAAIRTVDSYLKNNFGLEAHYQQTAAMHAGMR